MIPPIDDPRPRRPASPRRWPFLYALLGIIVAMLASRSFYLQVVHGAAYRSDAEGNRISAIPITAPRGIVYDVNGDQLVENVASTDVALDPVSLPREEDEGLLLQRLPKLLDVTVDDVRAAITTARTSRRVTTVAAAVGHDTVLEIERSHAELPGVQLLSTLVRHYPLGEVTAPVLGYTSLATVDELTAGDYLSPTDISGKTGLERSYDQELHGIHGVHYVEVDADGVAHKEVSTQEATGGSDLHLTLDSQLQTFIVDVFREREAAQPDKQTRGAVIALDPRSGAVRALVSFPSYDPNVFSRPELRDQVHNVISDERELLFNRAIDGTYAPGSTIKPFIASAALEEDIITPQTTMLSTGGLSIGPWTFPDWRAGGHGVTDVHKAIADSVNTFFYIITGGDETRTGLGVERATDYLSHFGWGKPSGVDLPSEAEGFLPSPEWKERAKNESWYIGDTYHLAIGQGDVLATPLQLAAATAAVANGGTLHEPFLVRSEQPPGQEPELREVRSSHVPVAPPNLETVRNGMRQTVTDGSGRSLSSLPISLAGKTGTAQVGGTDDTHAWFTSFGPYEEPSLVVTVLLERGGEGDTDAVPVAKKIWEWWHQNRR